MKITRLWTKAAVVLGALLIQTLCVYLGQALAAEPSPPLLVTIGVNLTSTKRSCRIRQPVPRSKSDIFQHPRYYDRYSE
jgi:hypothetical protein